MLEKTVKRETIRLHEQNIRIRHLGKLDGLGESICTAISESLALTRNNDLMTVSVALNYGARDEIVRTCQRLLEAGKTPEDVDEAVFASYLDTGGMPDVDLLIRTGGELRISNFLLWQCAYAEFYFTETLWPDFKRRELHQALRAYAQRHRRFGKVSDA